MSCFSFESIESAEITLKSPFVIDDCVEWLFLDEITSFVDGLSVDLMVFPIDGCLHWGKDINDCLWDFRADTVSREQHNFLILKIFQQNNA